MIIGIDPGKTGAVATMTDAGVLVAVNDLPIETYLMSRGGKPQWRLSVRSFVEIINDADLNGHLLTIMIEEGWARPGEGVSASYRAGRMLGAIETGCMSVRPVRPLYVLPQAWKKYFCLIGKEKTASLDLARKYYPDASLARKKDHNRAEAILIARYAYELRARLS
jgi:crossover junction endodeoxyribonuclease RuvC